MLKLVIPIVVMVTSDDYSIATMLVPAAVQSAVMSVELGARAVTAIVIAIASDPNAKALCVRH